MVGLSGSPERFFNFLGGFWGRQADVFQQAMVEICEITPLAVMVPVRGDNLQNIRDARACKPGQSRTKAHIGMKFSCV